MAMNIDIDTDIKKEKVLAPILFFAFNRPEHAQSSIKALAEACLANQSEVFVFIDGPKTDLDKEKIIKVRRNIEAVGSFKKIEIIQRTKNIGLANNISDGVGQIINTKGRVIVLEDDIIVSKGFLKYMNYALDYYEDNPIVWHIGGYNEDITQDEHTKVFFSRVMRCWGWATWKNRWAHYRREPEKLIQSFSKSDIYKFNLDGVEDFWAQVLKNESGKINTWAVFWYATIFKNNGLCLNPVISHVRNIGFDSTGTHCRSDNGKHSVKYLNVSEIFIPPPCVIEDAEIIDKLKKHFKRYKKQKIATKLFKSAIKLFKQFKF